ncbi:adhesin [Streptomyces sp. SCSIO 30461]|uniref:adhesin n=1 Tax=Streptomyces sp. SCSIO 30461 TaxID=3118085 RepID=UPI0030CF48D7
MACERCGSDRYGALPGTTCPECGFGVALSGDDDNGCGHRDHRDGHDGHDEGSGEGGGEGTDPGPDLDREWARWAGAVESGGPGDHDAERGVGGDTAAPLPANRLRKGLLAAAAVALVGCLVTSAVLLTGSYDDSEGGKGGAGAQASEDDIADRGLPTRLGPTALPDPSGTADGFAQWAGPGCTTGAYREIGRFENGTAAWYTVGSGGQDDDSCDGRFSSVPMSGSETRDATSSAVWSWRLDREYTRCSLAVYVPGTSRATEVAGDPTFYRVLADPDDTGSGYTGFGVRQTAHRGSLVPVGSYEVKGGTEFAVQLIDRGRDWGEAAKVGAHHAAAQMKLTCKP